MNIQKSLSIIGYSSWCGLGFIRGINSYTHNHNKDSYNRYRETENYLYLNSLCYGFSGLVIYANPLFLPVSVYKELYRLEVNLRNLENEKKTDFYNNLWY